VASAILLVKSGKWGDYHGDNRPIGESVNSRKKGGLPVRKLILIALASTAIPSGAWAQTAVGIGAARSDSAAVAGSRSTAIGGGASKSTSAITINQAPIPTATTATINNEGTSTVKNVPSVFAPGLAAAGLETCLGSVSGGGSFVGTGFSFGSTIPDPGCAARLDARTLWSMGLKKAAIARLCLGTDIRAAMPEICAQYLPQVQPVGYAVAGPSPAYYYGAGEYRGGPIMLVDGKTGKERLCQNYDEPKHRCRAWDGEARVVSHHRKPAVVVTAPAASSSAVAEK